MLTAGAVFVDVPECSVVVIPSGARDLQLAASEERF